MHHTLFCNLCRIFPNPELIKKIKQNQTMYFIIYLTTSYTSNKHGQQFNVLLVDMQREICSMCCFSYAIIVSSSLINASMLKKISVKTLACLQIDVFFPTSTIREIFAFVSVVNISLFITH